MSKDAKPTVGGDFWSKFAEKEREQIRAEAFKEAAREADAEADEYSDLRNTAVAEGIRRVAAAIRAKASQPAIDAVKVLPNPPLAEIQKHGPAAMEAFLATTPAAPPTSARTLAMMVEGWCEEVDRAARHMRNKGKGGMQVPYHGDFASASPSTIQRMEWWAREFRNLAATPPEKTEHEAARAVFELLSPFVAVLQKMTGGQKEALAIEQARALASSEPPCPVCGLDGSGRARCPIHAPSPEKERP